MNRNSNTYTILYSAIMVVLVAAALAFTAISLKEPQDKNKEVEKKMNILMAVNKAKEANTVADKNKYIEKEYQQYIVETYMVDMDGNKVEGDAFKADLKKELAAPDKDRKLPVFVFSENGNQKYIFPVLGRGLWGPLWGYIALEKDFNTIAGVSFDHKGETPGLGAEISTSAFQKPFEGKKIFNGDNFVSITVQKPGPTPDEYTVDGISGGTITGKGLQKTIFDCLSNYKKYFALQKKEIQTSVIPQESPSDSTQVNTNVELLN